MTVRCLRLLHPLHSKTLIKPELRSLQSHQFKTQIAFSKNSLPKPALDDSLLLCCLSHGRLQEARNLLDKLLERDCHNRVYHWTSLLTKYAKCGFVDEARALFEIMPERNVVTYNAMLSGYVQNGRLSEASKFFGVMPDKNVVSWTSMLCGLADAGKIFEAMRLFEVMPERNVVSWNSMVIGLIRNADLEGAREVFDQMPNKNIVSFNTIISGYAENCQMDKARVIFDKMQYRNVITWTSMITGYCRVGNVDEGYSFFRRMPERNIVSWTAMIGGFAWNGFYKEALMLFLELKGSREINPNGETFISLAYACAGMGLTFLGKQLHSQLIVSSWNCDDFDGRISKSLIHMYSVLGVMDFAHNIFIRDSNFSSIQCCNFMINGYIRIGQLGTAENLFGSVAVRDKISWTSMINGYFIFGQVSKACRLFNNMPEPERDEVAWTTMISGHVQNELFAEANNVFSEMRARGISPLSSSYSILLGAAGATSCLDQGRQLHCLVIKTQHEFDLILENSLISMYAKCGEINSAYSIFSNMIFRDLISWNSIIMGFSDNGLADKAILIFKTMLQSGTLPNSITFLGLLSACSHAGRVSQGWEFFNSMSGVYAIKPGVEHYVSIINLLGRAGKLKEAECLVSRLPFEADLSIWGALLGVCGFRQTNADIAKRAAKRVLELDRFNAPAHVALCNIYAANGMHMEEKMLRKAMGTKGVRKVPGCSWIVLKGKFHAFLSGDKPDPLVGEMLLLLFGNVAD